MEHQVPWRGRKMLCVGVQSVNSVQGEDAGGLYRESLDMMCQELMSSTTPLFIPCPNAREDMGDNRSDAIICCERYSHSNRRDKYVPRPTATRPLHLQMFMFLGKVFEVEFASAYTAVTGKLFGLAVRTKVLLKLNLPSIVWKVSTRRYEDAGS